MSDTSNDYQRINCDFYDHIEILALRKTWVRIEYSQEGESVIEVTKLFNTKTESKVEYAVTEDGQEIRMDLIKSITPINPATDMRVNLLEKLEYNHWANQKFIGHLESLNDYPSSAGLRISHIINAHDIWNRRILQMSQRFNIWQESATKEWPDILVQVYQESKKILKQGQLDRIIKYKNTKGDPYHSTIADIIYHVINHSTYHRGQISDILSSEGFKAVPTDYILYSRIKSYQL